MRIQLTLRDTNLVYEPYNLSWIIRDNALGSKFAELFRINMCIADHPIEKTFALHGWCTDYISTYPRNLQYLCDRMNYTIREVNKGMVPLGYPEIKLVFSLDALRDIRYQTLMNEIHHHFELLIGQVWAVSPWYNKASDEIKSHIRQLNNLTHEIESIVDTIKQKLDRRSRTPWVPPFSLVCGKMGQDKNQNYFDTKVIHEITDDEYACFEKIHHWGQMILYYAQLGKSHLDAFNDGDEVINRENISSHRYITGEFCVPFLDMDNSINDKMLGYERFMEWCKKNDFDVNDVSLGLGVPVVADLDFKGKSAYELAMEIKKRNDIYSLALTDENNNTIVERIYEHTWRDEEAIISH